MLIYSESNIDAKAAYQNIKSYIRKTPLEECKELLRICKGHVHLKLENWQKTGSFKIRGALNRMLMLSDEEKSRGVITASAGNHGLGVAFASKLLGIRTRIVLPVNAAATKVKMLNSYGVEVIQAGRDYDEAEDVAYRIKNDCGLTFIHAFDNPAIISGNGTIALEILSDLPDTDVILVPVGGGGLISGMAITAKQIKPHVKIIGVQSKASPAMYRAYKANHVMESPIENTIADGLAGRLVSPNILPSIQHYVDELIVVNESDIIRAIIFLLQYGRILTEGAAAVVVAALLTGAVSIENQNCVALLTGRNIDLDIVKLIIKSDETNATLSI